MKDHEASVVAPLAPLFLRRRDTATALAISESLVLVYERRGWLPVVRLPKVKAEGARDSGGIRHAREDVEALGRRIRAGELGDHEATK
jgi:hypothetical protein